jgi:hypothetical protein
VGARRPAAAAAGGEASGRQHPRLLALDGQRLAAGREHGEPGHRPQQPLGERRRRLDHVLAVVEHEQGRARVAGGPAQRLGDRVDHVAPGRRAHAEDGGHGRRGVGARGHRGQLHPPHAPRVPRLGRGADGVGGHLSGEPRLAGAPGPGDGDQPGVGERVREVGPLAGAPHERRQRRRDVVRHRGGRSGGRGVAGAASAGAASYRAASGAGWAGGGARSGTAGGVRRGARRRERGRYC